MHNRMLKWQEEIGEEYSASMGRIWLDIFIGKVRVGKWHNRISDEFSKGTEVASCSSGFYFPLLILFLFQAWSYTALL